LEPLKLLIEMELALLEQLMSLEPRPTWLLATLTLVAVIAIKLAFLPV
jgi:hypothetical protein